ncbi:hypothetical protein EVAR_63681_1 [Eumeta japonica]|uniref:Uncharacterized protein n=1 Tax=Eumeta variegata TaxID=151549 RepID=A0A4C1ZQE5_EUMVA|nr:hypothetical protein EVAR_63681_1 [Eumeta japonica]
MKARKAKFGYPCLLEIAPDDATAILSQCDTYSWPICRRRRGTLAVTGFVKNEKAQLPSNIAGRPFSNDSKRLIDGCQFVRELLRSDFIVRTAPAPRAACAHPRRVVGAESASRAEVRPFIRRAF